MSVQRCKPLGKTDFLEATDFKDKACNTFSCIDMRSRILPAERMALAGIRAQFTFMAMGQAAAAASALAVHRGVPSREIDSKDIVALTMEHGAVPV